MAHRSCSFTTSAQFPDGSATVPSIAFTSDVDATGTGFYRNTANEIGNELCTKLKNAFVFYITFENGTTVDNFDDVSLSVGTR